jgi:hypothetical protein
MKSAWNRRSVTQTPIWSASTLLLLGSLAITAPAFAFETMGLPGHGLDRSNYQKQQPSCKQLPGLARPTKTGGHDQENFVQDRAGQKTFFRTQAVQKSQACPDFNPVERGLLKGKGLQLETRSAHRGFEFLTYHYQAAGHGRDVFHEKMLMRIKADQHPQYHRGVIVAFQPVLIRRS